MIVISILIVSAIVSFLIKLGRKNKISTFVEISSPNEESDCLNIVIGLPLMPSLNKIVKKIKGVKGVYVVVSSQNSLVVQKYSDFTWQQTLPKIKKVIKSEKVKINP